MTTTHATPLSAEDLEVVHLIHSALRRDTERLADFAQRWRTADPGTHDALLLGWHGFSTELHTHHSIEDVYVWPFMRPRLAHDTAAMEVLDAMEAEHAVIDPALAEIETALDDRETATERLGGLLDGLVTSLGAHLAHEERDAFPLIEQTITKEEWHDISMRAFAQLEKREVSEMLPYLFEGAPKDRVATVVKSLPVPVRVLNRFWWTPRYARERRWE
ncbi:MAG: hemerythrin domain-containing protein [Rhodococcus sp. (in: high G+C Gram-positive bacteria)]|uniref:hemerythrin domain-containing protein n=1 Tax=Rhodococcus TaxID=1827 RepID=UPI001324F6EB|nr:hemerythrin domain-containing protein [Rhodococcus rhodochrous]